MFSVEICVMVANNNNTTITNNKINNTNIVIFWHVGLFVGSVKTHKVIVYPMISSTSSSSSSSTLLLLLLSLQVDVVLWP